MSISQQFKNLLDWMDQRFIVGHHLYPKLPICTLQRVHSHWWIYPPARGRRGGIFPPVRGRISGGNFPCQFSRTFANQCLYTSMYILQCIVCVNIPTGQCSLYNVLYAYIYILDSVQQLLYILHRRCRTVCTICTYVLANNVRFN